MKKIFSILLLISIFLAGCKPPRADKIEVLSVTIEPQKYFLEQIVKDKFKVNCVVPPGSNPESFDITPSQMMALDKSDIYFKVGYMGIENTLIDKIAKDKSQMKVVDCGKGIDILQDHDCIDHEHNHQNHNHEGGDPHIWSSPQTAKIMAGNMYKAIVEKDKANEDFYRQNYNELIIEFNQTDSIIKSYIDKAPSKAFIIYHPALSYFAEEYGLTQYSIEYEGKNPSPSQLKALIDKAKAEGVKTVFIQQEYDTKNAETIAEAIGGKTVPINLLSYYWKNEMIKIAKAIAQENE